MDGESADESSIIGEPVKSKNIFPFVIGGVVVLTVIAIIITTILLSGNNKPIENAVDLITSKFSKFAEVYQTYQDITKALNERNSELLESTILDYQKTNTEMDTAIQTLRQNRKYVLNSAKFEYSNGPLEGINRKIKTLKRTCYGFANQKFFFLRIDCIFS